MRTASSPTRHAGRLPNTNRKLDESRMSEEFISEICKANGGFRTPELNEKIYLHFRGFRKMEGLDSFVCCRALWLENNLIAEIEGIERLTVLDSLFLQHNQISKLPTSLTMTAPLLSLRSLNVSHNALVSLNGIEYFPNLEKLLVSNNKLECIAAIGSLERLSILDVSHNRLSDSDAVRNLLRKTKHLASLMMHGNDVTQQVKQYRKVILEENPCLRFLDEYPVFDDERRCAVAFVRSGGAEAERKERVAIRQEEADRQSAQREFFAQLVESAKHGVPRTRCLQQRTSSKCKRTVMTTCTSPQ